jgi:2',3'-cyclic-nucleotide 2'-phosphodiesterase
MRILFIGDIVGRPGRDLTRRGVPALIEHHAIDLVIANVENAAAGFGVTREIGEAIRGYGVDVMTSGNHVWDKKEAIDYVALEPRLLRPANFPAGVPGSGRCVVPTRRGEPVAVLNLMGRVFMVPTDNPFDVALREVETARREARVVIVDFHAEATSEKIAMGWHLDGRATAVVGTHTHVPTADGRVLPGGTAYISDVGMTGPRGGVIGVRKEQAIRAFVTHMTERFETSEDDPWLMGVVIRCSAPMCADAIEQVLEPLDGPG